MESRASRVSSSTYASQWLEAQDPADLNSVRYALKRSLPLIGDLSMRKVDGLALATLQKNLRRSYKPSTVELTMIYVKAVCRQAVSDGLLHNDPTERLAGVRRDPRDPQGVVTADQVPSHAEAVAISSATKPRFRAGMALGLGCGLRMVRSWV